MNPIDLLVDQIATAVADKLIDRGLIASANTPEPKDALELIKSLSLNVNTLDNVVQKAPSFADKDPSLKRFSVPGLTKINGREKLVEPDYDLIMSLYDAGRLDDNGTVKNPDRKASKYAVSFAMTLQKATGVIRYKRVTLERMKAGDVSAWISDLQRIAVHLSNFVLSNSR